jgi:transposase
VKLKRLSRRNLQDTRAQFVRMVDAGVPAGAVMAALQLSRSTYFQWRRMLRAGAPALEVSAARGGGVSKLTEDQIGRLRSWLIGRDPRQFQFDFALWTRNIVRELIDKEFGVQMTPQGIGKLLHRMGLSPQRPRYRAGQQDPAAVARWRVEEFPAIRARARKEGAVIYFGDEAGVRTDHHAGTTWAPVGCTPTVEVTGERVGVNMVSAVSLTGELHFMVHTGRFDADVFIEFCTALLADNPGRKVFLVLDNLSVHKAKVVTKYLTATEGRLTLYFLPPYSPELNPDESVWKHVKNDQIARAGIRRGSELFERTHQALQRLADAPDLVRGFFGDPHLAYIHESAS